MASSSLHSLRCKNSNPVEEVDFVIWTKNSSATLAMVLNRLENVIPHKFVRNKIVVDDHSTDNTVDIGKSLGWKVYINEGNGIPDAANTALKHVTSPFFISIEHDLLLAEEWWRKIPYHMRDEQVAVAQGIRFSTHSTLAALDEYFQIDCKRPYVTIDNNIYRTKIIREVGGFPKSCPVCVDLNLRDIVRKAGFKWIVDPTVISQHIRSGIRRQLKHKHEAYIRRKRDMHDKFSDVWKFLFTATFQSPIRGFYIAYKKKHPEIFFVYPMFRFAMVKSCLERRKLRKL